MIKVQDRRAFKLEDRHLEAVSGESLTVPNQAYSLKELIRKYSEQGTIPSITRDVIYTHSDESEDHDSPDLAQFQRMDFVDRDQIRQEVNEKMDFYRSLTLPPSPSPEVPHPQDAEDDELPLNGATAE